MDSTIEVASGIPGNPLRRCAEAMAKVVVLILAAILPLGPASGAEQCLAILTFAGKAPGGLAEALTDRARIGALDVTSARDCEVMSGEATRVLIAANQERCPEVGPCYFEVLRSIGARHVVTGDVRVIGGRKLVDLKMHEARTGLLSAAETAEADDDRDLLRAVEQASASLVRRGIARSRPGTTLLPEPAAGVFVEHARPRDRSVPALVQVDFESAPPGAIVRIGDEILCQATPCSRYVHAGSLRVQMELERYRTLAIKAVAQQGTRVAVELEPTFGWLSVDSTPQGLEVRIDGRPAGKTPVSDLTLEPGRIEVAVADRCYLASGERIDLKAGDRRRVHLSAQPRMGTLRLIALDEAQNAADATVVIDGNAAGRTGALIDAPTCATSAIAVTGSGRRWEGPIHIQEGRTQSLTVSLTPETSAVGDATMPGAVLVEFGSTAPARLWLDGRSLDLPVRAWVSRGQSVEFVGEGWTKAVPMDDLVAYQGRTAEVTLREHKARGVAVKWLTTCGFAIGGGVALGLLWIPDPNDVTRTVSDQKTLHVTIGLAVGLGIGLVLGKILGNEAAKPTVDWQGRDYRGPSISLAPGGLQWESKGVRVSMGAGGIAGVF